MRKPKLTQQVGTPPAAPSPDFRALFDASPDRCLVLAPDATIVAVSDAYLAATGTRRADIVGRPMYEIFPDDPDGMRRLRASLARVVSSRVADSMPAQTVHVADASEGEGRYWKSVSSPLLGATGEVAWIIHRVDDVTESVRLQAQNAAQAEALREASRQLRAEAQRGRHTEDSEQQRRVYEAALSNTADFNYVFDLDGRFTFVNSRLLALWQREASEALGKTFFELDYPPELAARLHRQIREVIATRQPVRDETPFTSAFGERQYEYIFVPVLGTDGTVEAVTGSTRDITERKEMEEALRQSEARFRIFAESGPQMIWAAGADGLNEYINPRWCEYTGLTAEETADRESSRRVIHPDDYDAMRARWNEALATGEPFEAEIRLRRASDGAYRWFLTRGVPVRNREGRIVQWIGANTDIEDQKRAEEHLKEADRRKTHFLALLAHELRNPLAPIRTGVQILRNSDADPAMVRRALEMMERQVGQMVRLVDDLLDVSRITQDKIELRKERLELATVIRRAVEMSRPLVEAKEHELVVTLASEPVVLEADLVRLAQVVSNLLNNSARYTPKRGRIELSAGREGERVVIRVRDNGIGIPAAMLPNIFDMFTQGDRYQERTQGGLGLGLSLVKSLIQLHGGNVEASSPGEGRGSEFVVRLPVGGVHGTSSRARPVDERRKPVGPSRRILVVDDNRDSCDSLALLLEIMGHEVRVSYDGPHALETARTYRPDTVLLDIGLPGMSGHEVARRMRQELDMKGALLVAMTGWGQDEDRQRSEDAGFDHHLVKPVEPDALETLLASLADRTPHGRAGRLED